MNQYLLLAQLMLNLQAPAFVDVLHVPLTRWQLDPWPCTSTDFHAHLPYTMASNPDDVANNPYNEGGARSAAAPQPSVWFCHSCQRDFPGNQLLHTPDPACPHCHGDFVEETGCVNLFSDCLLVSVFARVLPSSACPPHRLVCDGSASWTRAIETASNAETTVCNAGTDSSLIMLFIGKVSMILMSSTGLCSHLHR